MLTLYKFRSLGDDVSYDRAKKILETGRFWCSPLWELNDPMEGVYTYLDGQDVAGVFAEKNQYRICSFSGSPALEKPTMWGYYANGFRGIAIEINVPDAIVQPVNYPPAAAKWLRQHENENLGELVERVLTTKLKLWKSEDEYRYLTKEPDEFHAVGPITGVYFGDPYCGVENMNQVIEHSSKLQQYTIWKEQLAQIARGKGYSCFSAGIKRIGAEWKVQWQRIPNPQS